jgi:hypothetical protein
MPIIDQAEWEYRQLKLSQLVPYPAQDYFFADTTMPSEDAMFQESLKSGQRDPIHVMPPKNAAGLPPYTVLDGHRRKKGLMANGETHGKVVIRHDLVGADAATVELVFLDFSGHRNLDTIDQARIALRRFQIEKNRPRGEVHPWEESEARDRVGKAIGMTGRNLGRYFRVLLAPLEVQNAVRDGKLALVAGEKVSWLSKDQQAKIAERIRAGEKAKDVVAVYVASSNGRHKKAEDGFVGLVKFLERALADLEDRPDEIYRLTIKQHAPLLKRGQRFFARLLAEGRKKPGSLTGM